MFLSPGLIWTVRFPADKRKQRQPLAELTPFKSQTVSWSKISRLVVVVVRYDETFALENHIGAPAVRVGIAQKTVVYAINESMEHAKDSASHSTGRSTGETTS